MYQPRRLCLIASIVLCFVLQALGADKYTDENRPYEFGFKIDGQQHRHESKDKDGIIMGEFGFVTADDVYHVTVYATDKEGRFKILSMKNIHLKSSSTSSLGITTSARQGHALALPPTQPASVQAGVVSQQQHNQGGALTSPQLASFTPQAPVPQGAFAPQPGKPNKPIAIEPPGKSCSSCSLPTTTTRAPPPPPPPPPAYNQVTDNNNYKSPNQFTVPRASPQNQQAFPPSSTRQQNIAQGGPIGSSYSPQGGQQNYPSGQQNIPQQGLIAPGDAPSFAPQPGLAPQNYPSGQQNIPQQGLFAQGGAPSFTSKLGQAPQNYPSSQQNIPQQGLIAPSGAPSFAPQSGQTPQNNRNSPNDSQKPYAPNSYEQPGGGVLPSAGQPQGVPRTQAGLGQTYSGEPNRLFGGNNNPYAGAGPSGSATSVPDTRNYANGNGQQAGSPGQNFYPQGSPGQGSYPQDGAGERTAKQYNGPRQQFDSQLGPNRPQNPGAAQGQRGSAKPTLFSAQMQIVDKNTDIYALGPNEQKGLPPGLNQGDVTTLLYTFNYTLGFHGHFEEGYTNGVKKGYYFVTGRNGVRTRIDYVADDTGFHPKVSQEVLDLLSDDVPKPETEKDEKYGLKGYEFKWLYYPVESKNR